MGIVKEPTSILNGGDRMTKSKTLMIVDRIKQDYEEKGRINKLELSREFNVNRATMTKLVNGVTIDMDKLPAIQTEMKMIFERIRNRLFKLLDTLEVFEEQTGQPNIKAELEVSKAIMDNVEKFYKLLQELGEAPKVADNINLTAQVTNKSINIQVIDNREQIKQIEQ